MAVTQSFSAEDKTLTVNISGRFDFGLHQEFRTAYEQLSGPKPSAYVINLNNATYLDSSALGMLLLLRDHAGGDNARITLKNANADVTKILAISNFDKLFTIE